MNNRQAMDTHGSGACTKLMHHQLISSQYKSGRAWVRGKRGYGLAMGRREKTILGFPLKLFWGNVLLGWHITQKREIWVGLTKCIPWGIVRENSHPYSDGNATVSKQTKWDSFVWELDVAWSAQVSGDGWVADRLVGGLERTPMLGQKLLRGKIVKTRHDRQYKRELSRAQ